MVEKRADQRVRVQRLTHSLKRLGRSVGRRDRSSIARQVVADRKLLKRTVPLIGKTMAQEMKALCSVDAESILSRTDAATLQAFSWKQLLNELHKTAPITTTLLSNSLTCLRSSRSKKGPRRANNDAIVGLCCGLLARARSQKMNLIQRLISVLLYGGHASKQARIMSDVLQDNCSCDIALCRCTHGFRSFCCAYLTKLHWHLSMCWARTLTRKSSHGSRI